MHGRLPHRALTLFTVTHHHIHPALGIALAFEPRRNPSADGQAMTKASGGNLHEGVDQLAGVHGKSSAVGGVLPEEILLPKAADGGLIQAGHRCRVALGEDEPVPAFVLRVLGIVAHLILPQGSHHIRHGKVTADVDAFLSTEGQQIHFDLQSRFFQLAEFGQHGSIPSC